MDQNQINVWIEKMFDEDSLFHAVFSSPLNKGIKARKIEIKPILVKGSVLYQVTEHIGPQVFHSNLTKQESLKRAKNEWISSFKQSVFYTQSADCHVLVSKKGKATMLKKPPSRKKQELSHNRIKQHVFSEGTPLPFLVELGVMKSDGSVLAGKRDKFRQINCFLEIVEQIYSHLPSHTKLSVVDFGCGKAYLTFALYYYLHVLKDREVDIFGIDLKADVLESCQKLADSLGYKGLRFFRGSIEDYPLKEQPDLVVALHACDTATDVVLAKAVGARARVILSAPCCQHELYKQVKSEPLQGILDHGILKERLAALATDAARALLLEMAGYRAQVMEFIDPEHTPKNVLIKAIRGNAEKHRMDAALKYRALKEALQITPKLENVSGSEQALRFINRSDF